MYDRADLKLYVDTLRWETDVRTVLERVAQAAVMAQEVREGRDWMREVYEVADAAIMDITLLQVGPCTRALIDDGYAYTVMQASGAYPYAIQWERLARIGAFAVHNPKSIHAVADITPADIERTAREFARVELRQQWGEI